MPQSASQDSSTADGSHSRPNPKRAAKNPFVGSPGTGSDHKAGLSDTDARILRRRRRNSEAGQREPRIEMN